MTKLAGHLSGFSDAIRGQPSSHKIKRAYSYAKYHRDHHSDILGTGGYSRVERVKSLKLNQYVAMKIVNKTVISNRANYLKLLARMHDMYEDLDTDIIIRSYEWFESLDRYYIVFELAAGGDMFDRISNMGRYAEPVAKAALQRILKALDFTQNHGLIHRDIKPENFFYRDINDPLSFGLSDFGLALVLDEQGPGDTQRFYEVAGTPGYAAPEIYRKTGYGKKSDIFGVGIVGYIMLSSWSPWSSSDPKQLMIETMTQEVKYYPSHWGGVSDLAKDFITQLTAKDPNRRLSCKEALQHPWFKTETGRDQDTERPVAQKLMRAPTAKAETYYDGCELAKQLTKHCDGDDLTHARESIRVAA